MAYEEGKDWDILLPYILFTYKEVSLAATGFYLLSWCLEERFKDPLMSSKKGEKQAKELVKV